MDSHSHHHGEAPDASLGIEVKDADIPLVVWTGVAIIATLVFCMIFGLFHLRYEMAARPAPEEAAVLFKADQKLPPEPRLQAFPYRDLAAYKEKQNAAVEGYGMVDKEAGVAHIPVEKAIENVLSKGGASVLTAGTKVADPKKADAAKKAEPAKKAEAAKQ